MAYNNLGGILKMQGRAAEAISCYEQVALLQPTSPEVCSPIPPLPPTPLLPPPAPPPPCQSPCIQHTTAHCLIGSIPVSKVRVFSKVFAISLNICRVEYMVCVLLLTRCHVCAAPWAVRLSSTISHQSSVK